MKQPDHRIAISVDNGFGDAALGMAACTQYQQVGMLKHAHG
ncbi:hypothetical protein [Acetobacter pasteurianus]|nr:hypothetical protein [Acetobacter pasteurianus]